MSLKPLRNSLESRNVGKSPAVLSPTKVGGFDPLKAPLSRGLEAERPGMEEKDGKLGGAVKSAEALIELPSLEQSTTSFYFEPLQLAQTGSATGAGSTGGSSSATGAGSAGGSGSATGTGSKAGAGASATAGDGLIGGMSATTVAAVAAIGVVGVAAASSGGGSSDGAPNAAPNVAPSFAAKSVTKTGTEDTVLTDTAVATDVDGTALTYTIKATGAANGTAVVDSKTGKYSYTPKANYNGDDKFVIVASDGVLTAEQEVNVKLAAVNDAPVINPASTTFLEVPAGESRSFVIDADDVDVPAQKLTPGISSQPANGKILEGNIYQPNPGFTGNDKFTVSVSDGVDATKYDVSVKVGPNLAPTFSPAAVSVKGFEDKAVTGDVKALDPEGSSLIYSVATPPMKGTLTLVPGTGAYTYNSNPDYSGPDSFAVSAKDPAGNFTATNLTVNLDLAEVNDAPRFATTSVAVTGTENTRLNGTVSAKDPENSAVTYSVKAGEVTSGKVDINETSGAYTYTPAPNVNGSDSFVVIASDGKASSEQTVNVTLVALKTVSLDDYNKGNLNTIAPVKLDTGAYRLTDSKETGSRVEVTGFSADDFIQFNGPSSEYSFGYLDSSDTLTVSTTFNNTVISAVNIAGVSIPGGVVFNEALAESGLAAAFGVSDTDFFRFSDSTGNGGTTLNKLTSLDYDSEPGISTFQQFNANESGALNVAYTDSTKIASRASISNFGRSGEGVGDTITVDSSTSLWSFGSSNKVGSSTDIDISYSDGAKVNAIKLLGVVPHVQNVDVLSEATAELALGYDFFKSSEPINSAVLLDFGPGDLEERTFNAGAGANQYRDDISKDSLVRIFNIGSGDSVTVSNLSDALYNRTSAGYFASAGQDIVFAARSADNLKQSSITLVGANPTESTVYNEATAELVVGFDFFRFA